MSIHRSLSSKIAFVKQRNVLTRAERVKKLQEEGKWNEEKSIFGLPKVKVTKIKIKARKSAPKEEKKTATPTAPTAEQKPSTQKSEKQEKK